MHKCNPGDIDDVKEKSKKVIEGGRAVALRAKPRRGTACRH